MRTQNKVLGYTVKLVIIIESAVVRGSAAGNVEADAHHLTTVCLSHFSAAWCRSKIYPEYFLMSLVDFGVGCWSISHQEIALLRFAKGRLIVFHVFAMFIVFNCLINPFKFLNL